MRLFWRVSLYSGLAALATSAPLLVSAEVVRNDIREEVAQHDAEDEALSRRGAPFEEQAAAQRGHDAAMRPKYRLQGRLEISGLVALIAGLVLTVVGALASGLKRPKPRTGDPFAGREDEGW